jgi:hypothetical protein
LPALKLKNSEFIFVLILNNVELGMLVLNSVTSVYLLCVCVTLENL